VCHNGTHPPVNAVHSGPTWAPIAAGFPLTKLPAKLSGNFVDTNNAAEGIVGTDKIFVAAVPMNGLGSGGAFGFTVYGLRGGKPALLQEVTADGGGVILSIKDARLYVVTSAFLPQDTHASPSGKRTAVYQISGGRVQMVSSNVTWNYENVNRQSSTSVSATPSPRAHQHLRSSSQAPKLAWCQVPSQRTGPEPCYPGWGRWKLRRRLDRYCR